MLPLRIVSGTALIGLFAATVFWASPWAAGLFLGLGCLLLALALHEFYALVRLFGYPGNPLLTITASMLLTIALGVASLLPVESAQLQYAAYESLIVLAFIVAVVYHELARENMKLAMFNLLFTFGGFVYVAWTMLAIAKVYFLLGQAMGTGPYLFFFLVVVTKSGDIGGYVFGKTTALLPRGNHKMTPVLSPGKSWEGFVGSILFSIAAAFACIAQIGDRLFVHPHRPIGCVDAIVLGILLAVVGLIGDLSISLLKRVAGKKDSGAIVPGMGGVLDVVDSLLLASPSFYCYAIAVL